eukprot:6794879-Prymnesium_polylepis.1
MHGGLEGLLLDLQQLRGVQPALRHVPVEVGRPTERAVRAVAVVALQAARSSRRCCRPRPAAVVATGSPP